MAHFKKLSFGSRGNLSGSFVQTKLFYKKVKIHRSMIKRYNESDYNLQLRFLVSLRSSEGNRKYHGFLFLFIFVTRNRDIVTLYDDKSY